MVSLVKKSQNIVATLMIFFGQQKTLWKTWDNLQNCTAEFFHELSKGKKISNEQIYHYEEVTQSINSQTYFKYPGSYGLTEEFYKPFSNELSPVVSDAY